MEDYAILSAEQILRNQQKTFRALAGSGRIPKLKDRKRVPSSGPSISLNNNLRHSLYAVMLLIR